MDPRSATLLRYRFGELAQLHNHLHVVGRHMVLFYRDGQGALPAGTRVVLELAFRGSEQVSTLRGTVLSRVGGAMSGLWLEFPDVRLAKKAGQGPEAIALRKRKRLGCDLVVEVKQGKTTFLGRLTDVNMNGARLIGVDGLRAGVNLEVRLIAPEPGWPGALGGAEVVRAEPGDVALRFLRNDATSRVAVSKLLTALQQSWAKATEIAHPPACCEGGQVLEPARPPMWLRF